MILTYLILKTTFDGILQEANRLYLEQEISEKSRVLKLELLQLRKQFERGTLSEEIYLREEKRIIGDLAGLSRLAKGNQQSGSGRVNLR